MPVSGLESVGQLIRERRETRGWNQVQLADALGKIDRTYVSRWENDKHRPGPRHAEALARELGGDPSEYRGLSGAPRRLQDVVAELAARVDRLERLIEKRS
ncbi:MAG TPA: helix-turn-helix transcriptional regulator [Gemmatimonadales bacterium]|nr:helix-turn-helix transcriptional regulator [Gemmatimonadales bacterium]